MKPNKNKKWKPIESAPRDGSWIQAVIEGHGSDNVIVWEEGFIDEQGNDCGAWCFATDQEPPESWTDGVYWECNQPAKPTKWIEIE